MGHRSGDVRDDVWETPLLQQVPVIVVAVVVLVVAVVVLVVAVVVLVVGGAFFLLLLSLV